MNVLAFSGGKDSTALALRMHELGEDFELLFTPTGRELPDLDAHLDAVAGMVEKTIIRPDNRSLAEWIAFYNALPNHRQRWCTRQIKIEPCIAFLKKNPGSTLIVGLRADEQEREGLYGPYAHYRYPMRDEWGWNVDDVWRYLAERGVKIPRRTDCDCCYGQRLGEWYMLWRDWPDQYAWSEARETQTGHTFRSPRRDTWPAALSDLRAEFEKGRVPRGVDELDADGAEACRVCRL